MLTNRRLVFLAHRGQPFHYQLSLPLDEVLEANSSQTGLPGGLRVTMVGENTELFTFGAIRPAEPEIWAIAIAQAQETADSGTGEGPAI